MPRTVPHSQFAGQTEIRIATIASIEWIRTARHFCSIEGNRRNLVRRHDPARDQQGDQYAHAQKANFWPALYSPRSGSFPD
jgi:hypothetical protein